MRIPIYQVDAFTGRLFGGNPAVVCPLELWLDDQTMQSIAMENNLSETALFVKEKGGFHIGWFTSVAEVDLCGHATLASAHVIFHHLEVPGDRILLKSLSGELAVIRSSDLLSQDFLDRLSGWLKEKLAGVERERVPGGIGGRQGREVRDLLCQDLSAGRKGGPRFEDDGQSRQLRVPIRGTVRRPFQCGLA